MEVAKERNEATYEKDLLQMVLEGAKTYSDANSFFSSGMSNDQFIVDNCKNIYLAGQNTTAVTTTWCLLLLAAYPEWQARVRVERPHELWGRDAHEFNPQRFENGILGACKVPQAYMPFGLGIRVCVGNHFDMIELKWLKNRTWLLCLEYAVLGSA
ncbi:hypothetical protein ACLB2K_073838 [Fragaria x ananassa]